MRSSERVSAHVAAGMMAAAAWFTSVAIGPANGQSPGEVTGGMISLGGRGWAPAETTLVTSDQSANQFGFDVRAGFATDYIYRGTTLSDHRPAVGAAFEASFAQFYAGVSVASVKLPTQPAAEIVASGGMRQKLADIDFDVRMSYFLYPGEIAGSTGINYWEAAVRADKRISDSFRVAGGFAYSPNVSNTGAWSWYAAAGIGYDAPSSLLPYDISMSVTGGAGYSWFGNQSLAFGGFPLPSYLNWQAGVTFTRKVFSLDLRYYDTNLSKENCFVLTGDPNAQPGGTIDPITNPTGLASNWCSATFVAKVSFAFN